MNSRMMRDHKDILTIMSFLDERNPFFDDKGLRNIATGVVADKSVNVDDAVNVGRKIVQSMKDQEIGDFVFKRSNQVVTFTSKIGAKVGDETISVDPQLLFQRLTAVGNLLMEDTGNMFSYELSTFPSSLFESGMPREANKPTLGGCIWNMGDCSCISLPSACLFVLDGGSLLQRLPWLKNATFESICQSYVDYVTKRYQNVVDVFDGYPNCHTTKDVTHMRRTRGITGPEIHFTGNMPCKSRKETFLSNTKTSRVLSIYLEGHSHLME